MGGELLVHGLAQLVDPRGRPSDPLGIRENAFVWIRDGEVAASGAMADLPADAAPPRNAVPDAAAVARSPGSSDVAVASPVKAARVARARSHSARSIPRRHR